MAYLEVSLELVSLAVPNSLTDSPSPIAARTLILVAKSVQNLANLVEFGAKVKTFWYFKMSQGMKHRHDKAVKHSLSKFLTVDIS